MAEPASASKARAFVCEHLLTHGLPHMVDDVRLVASELATNAMEHADTPFAVTLAERDGMVHLTVRDGSSVLPVLVSAQMTDTAGRGLLLVEQLSQEWGAMPDTAGAKSVWASFSTHTPE